MLDEESTVRIGPCQILKHFKFALMICENWIFFVFFGLHYL